MFGCSFSNCFLSALISSPACHVAYEIVTCSSGSSTGPVALFWDCVPPPAHAVRLRAVTAAATGTNLRRRFFFTDTSFAFSFTLARDCAAGCVRHTHVLFRLSPKQRAQRSRHDVGLPGVVPCPRVASRTRATPMLYDMSTTTRALRGP